MEKIIQLKITLVDSEPLIWRCVQVKGTTNFLELHMAIQLAMGWKNAHLFEFVSGEEIIGLPSEEDDEFDEILNATEEIISDFFIEPDQEMNYIYDFGDYWEHKIIVEKIFLAQQGVKYPLCIAGARNCPPEDIGGIQNFCDKLKAFENEKHPKHKETNVLFGKNYNPVIFDIDSANKQLSKINSYIKNMLE